MKQVTDALSAIAASLGVDFRRTMTLTEADFEVHNNKSELGIIIYVGASDIANEFEGAQIIDVIAAEIYFLGKASSKDMKGTDVDDVLETAKRLVDQTYAILNRDYAVKDIESYNLEGVGVLTDLYIGFKATIGIPFYNTGC